MTFVRRYPVAFFFVAAIGITYVAGIASFLLLRKAGIHWAEELVLKFGPTLAAILTLAFTTGRRGVADLLRQCVQWSGSVFLYATAILLQPLVLWCVLLIRGYGPQLDSVPLSAAFSAFAGQLVINVFLGGGLSEEPGWRGFMLPNLLARFSPLVASGLVAVAWFAWHIPGYILFNKGASDPILPFAVILVPFSLVLTDLYRRSNQGLVLPILLHGSINASFYAMEILLPEVISAPDFQPALDWCLAGVWCALGGIVIAGWYRQPAGAAFTDVGK